MRRRFKDADSVGKIVSEVTSRALQVALDGDRFDNVMRASVLDALLPGRGVCRVRYVPSLAQVGVTEETHEEGAEEPTHEAQEGYTEELEYEQAVVEHVDWIGFRRGYGRCWEEVQWVAFRCRLRKDDVAERFGQDIADILQYDIDEDNEDRKESEQAKAGRRRRHAHGRILGNLGQGRTQSLFLEQRIPRRVDLPDWQRVGRASR